MDKTKFYGMLGALFMVFALIGGANAATQSDSVTTTSTIPTSMGFSVIPDALTFNLNEYDVYKAATEGAVQLQMTGNVKADIFGKLGGTPSGIQFKNPYDNQVFGTSDSMVTGGMGPNENRTVNIMAKALAGKAPGSYNDVITFTAVSI